MPWTARTPDGQLVEFPDSVTQDQALAFLKQEQGRTSREDTGITPRRRGGLSGRREQPDETVAAPRSGAGPSRRDAALDKIMAMPVDAQSTIEQYNRDRLLGPNQGSISAVRKPEAGPGSIARGLAANLKVGMEGFQQAIGDWVPKPWQTEGQKQASADRQMRDVKSAQARADAARPEFETKFGSAAYSGLESLAQQIPGLAASAATGSIVPGLAYAGFGTAAEAYGRYRTRGATKEEAAAGALGEGVVEVGTELVPMGKIVNALGGPKSAKSVFRDVGESILYDIPGEQIATLAQDAIDTAIANPDKTWQDYANERPDAALQTLIATVVQGGVMAGGALTINEARSRIGQGPRPAGIREAARKTATTLTSEDNDSAIPNEAIAAGREVMADSEALSRTDAVLARAGLPKTMTRVAVTDGDGNAISGVIEDVFDDRGEQGVKIRLDNGGLWEESFADIAETGVSIVEAAPDTAENINARFARRADAARAARDAALAAFEGAPIPTGTVERTETVPAAVPTPGASGAAIDSYMAKARRAESGGNDQAKNPRSSATGRYQFTDGTWLATYKAEFGETGEGRAEILARRGNGVMQDRLMRRLTSDNAAILERAGLAVTDGNLYLAHFAGPGGATAILKADPNAAVETILGARAVSANPFLKGKSASDVIEWAAGKVGASRGTGAPASTVVTTETEYADPFEAALLQYNRSLEENDDSASAMPLVESPQAPVESQESGAGDAAPLPLSGPQMPPQDISGRPEGFSVAAIAQPDFRIGDSSVADIVSEDAARAPAKAFVAPAALAESPVTGRDGVVIAESAASTVRPVVTSNRLSAIVSNTSPELARRINAALPDGVELKPRRDGGYFVPKKYIGTVDAVVAESRAVAPSVRGTPIDGEWTAFAPGSGTLNIPRRDMPQIKAENRGAMVNFLNARGVAHQEQTVPAVALRPSQAEFSNAKVQAAKAFGGGNRAILVSNDGYILDGHHQWMAARDKGEDIRVIRLDAGIGDLINTVREMPTAETAGGGDIPAIPTGAAQTDGAAAIAARGAPSPVPVPAPQPAPQPAQAQVEVPDGSAAAAMPSPNIPVPQGRPTRNKPSAPVDLVKFVARNGGLSYDGLNEQSRGTGSRGHDLRNTGNLKAFVPGAGPLLRPGGLSLDAMGEKLWDAGYFGPPDIIPRPTENDVIETLDGLLGRGEKQYSYFDQAPAPKPSAADMRPEEDFIASAEAAGSAMDIREAWDAAAARLGMETLFQSEIDDFRARSGRGNAILPPLNPDETDPDVIGQYIIEAVNQELDDARLDAFHEVEDDLYAATEEQFRRVAEAEDRNRGTGGAGSASDAGDARAQPQGSDDGPGASEADGSPRRVASTPQSAANTGSLGLPGDEAADQPELDGAGRSGYIGPRPLLARLIERRFGNVVENEFGIQPSSLTGEEAQYLSGFRDADALRARIAKAVGERHNRLASKPGKESKLEAEASSSPPQRGVDKLISGRLHKRLAQLGLDDKVHVVVSRLINGDPRIAGSTLGRTITIALGSRQDAAFTLDHEIIHVLKGAGLFRDVEWKALERAVRADTALMESIARRYPEYDAAGQVEEAIADYHARWSRGEQAKGFARKALERISEVLRVIGQIFRREGLMTPEAALRAIGRGDVAARTATVSSEVSPARMSIASQTTGEKFKRWFGKSKVLDAAGNPLIVYHGSDADISTFGKSEQGAQAGGAFWFGDAQTASGYAQSDWKSGPRPGANVSAVYLRMENPFIYDAEGRGWHSAVKGGTDLSEDIEITISGGRAEWRDQRRRNQNINALAVWAKAKGYDGVIVQNVVDQGQLAAALGNVTSTSYGVFSSDQIKSATGNRGSFSRGNHDIRYSIAGEESRYEQDVFAAEWLSEMAAVDEVFRNSPANAKDLRGIFAGIMPGVQQTGVADAAADATEGTPGTGLDETLHDAGADRVTAFSMPSGRKLLVFERGGEVWLDVSRLRPGEHGSSVYQAVADYAFNNGKTFIGDPEGLSDLALRRRTEAMLSSAIKHGTTDHLAPHPYQLQGNAGLGVPPLAWRDGDTLGNIQNMVDVSVASLAHDVPQIRDGYFDFKTGTFRTGEGQPLSDELVDRWLDEAGRDRAPGAGRATLKRGILLRSLTRAQGGERPGLLELVLGQRGQSLLGPGLKDTFYSRTDAPFERTADGGPGGFSSGPVRDLIQGSASNSIDMTYSGIDKVREHIQDRMLPQMRVQEAVERALGRSLAENENAYLAEELWTGRAGRLLEQLYEERVEPLMAALHSEGVTADELETYLYARHAIERNAQIAKINPEFAPGEGSGMSDTQARAILSRAKKQGKTETLDALASIIDRINEEALQLRVDEGLLSDREALQWRETYKYYVPLRGRPEIDPDDAGSRKLVDRARSQSGISVRGKEGRRAFGRRSAASDILAHVILQAEEAIIRAEKNRAAKAFLRLAEANPDPDFWQIDKVTRTPVMDSATGLVRYENQSRLAAGDAPYTVTAKVDGVEHRITLNRDNPNAVRVAEAMRNLGGPEFGTILSFMATAGQIFSAINTRYNPSFVVRNALRDAQTMAFVGQMHAEEMPGFVAAVLRDYKHAMTAPKRGDGEWAKWRREWEFAGGKIYYNQTQDMDQIRKQIALRSRRIANPKSAAAVVTRFFDGVEAMNEAVERAIRLSVYKNAREKGKSKAEAASMARNITVNFTRKGKWSPFINALFPFFNASVQGSFNLVRALKKSKRVRRGAYAIVLAGFLADMLNSMVSGDDDDGMAYWDKVPEWEKSKNMILMKPDGSGGVGIKLPLAWGLNALFGLGRNASAMMRGALSPGEAITSSALEFYDAFNPLGGNGDWLTTIAPTVLDPWLEISNNRDFTGKPIQPEQSPYGTPKPDSANYYMSVDGTAKLVAKGLNRASGGDEVLPGFFDISPESIEHWAGFLTGGAGRFVGDIWSLVTSPLDPEREVTLRDVPILRDVVTQKSPWVDKSLFYERTTKVEKVLDDAKRYAEMGNQEGLQAYAERYRAVGQMDEITRQAKKEMTQLRAARNGGTFEYEMGRMDRSTYQEGLRSIRDREGEIIARYNRLWMERVEGVEPGG